MHDVLSRNWWALVMRGVVATTFGLLAWTWASAPLATVARAFGVFAVTQGVLASCETAGAAGPEDRPWPIVLEGLVGTGIGLVALAMAWTDPASLDRLVAAWLAVVGVLEGASVFDLRGDVTPKVVVALACFTIVAAFSLAIAAGATVVTTWLLGAWAVLFGATMLAVGRALRRDLEDELALVRRLSAP